MEYLMTYGWVLLVIVIAISILLSITVFHTPEHCIFGDPSFSCSGPRLLSKDPTAPSDADSVAGNLLYVTITNGMPGSIQIVGMACASSHAPARDDSNFVQQVFQVPSDGQDQPLVLTHADSFNTGTVPNNRFRLQCFDVDADGRVILSMAPNGKMLPAFLKPGTFFQGTLYVLYKSTSDPEYVPPKLVTGQIAVGVQ